MADELHFLCDEMLACRWLRIAGYDTAIAARGCRDRDLVEQAHAAVHVCPSCGQLYREGSHVRRIRRWLESFAHEKDKDDPR